MLSSLFCFVSPFTVLFCCVLFCFVLFCFVLFCFVLFCFVLFCFVLCLPSLLGHTLNEQLSVAFSCFESPSFVE